MFKIKIPLWLKKKSAPEKLGPRTECETVAPAVEGRPAEIVGTFYPSMGRNKKTGKMETVTLKRVAPKTPRNAPCPCGSGRKYKKCCGPRVEL